MARTNRTRYTVLGTLTRGPRSGYDIKKFIEGSINNFWRESYGQIYPTLRRLEEEGLVTKEADPRDGKPNRFIYAITDAGRDELRNWLAEPAEPAVPRLELLLKLFFGAQISPEANLRHIERHREELQAGLETCEGYHSRLQEMYPDSPDLPFWLMGLRQGILAHEALLRWCDEAEEAIKRLS